MEVSHAKLSVENLRNFMEFMSDWSYPLVVFLFTLAMPWIAVFLYSYQSPGVITRTWPFLLGWTCFVLVGGGVVYYFDSVNGIPQ